MGENRVRRIDSTYFRREGLRVHATLKGRAHEVMRSAAASVESFGAYALTNNVEYQENGIPFLRCVNIKNGFVSFADCLYIDSDAHRLLHKSAVEPETVLLTMSGSVGNSAVALRGWKYPINSNQDVAKIRVSSVDPYYLAAFLGSRYGKSQMERLPVGSVQQHIFLWMIEEMLVARLPSGLEARISSTVHAAYDAGEHSKNLLDQADAVYLRSLGLTNSTRADPLTYSGSVRSARDARRLDSEYFAPRILDLRARLDQAKQSVGDVAPSRREKFCSAGEGAIDYIEIGDLMGDGSTGSSSVDRTDAPSRATWHVHSGDVITSTVRPIRRLSAIISEEQDGFVCSSGFVVLSPKKIQSEVLLTYLRLPVFCELMNLYTSASMYPAISERDLLALPFAQPNPTDRNTICNTVRSARQARRRASALLHAAQRSVELAIEKGEAAANRLLDEAHK